MNHDENSLEQEFQLYSAILDIETTLNELNELMPADIVTTIRGLSAGIDSIKKLAELAKKSQNVELREGILNLREELLKAKENLLDVKQELAEKTEEIEKLKAENQSLKNPTSALIFDNKLGLYFENNGLSDRGIPFCTGCYDNNGKRIRLSKMSGDFTILGKYQCSVCKAVYQ
jgi:predicted component of type VI protein secretion system